MKRWNLHRFLVGVLLVSLLAGCGGGGGTSGVPTDDGPGNTGGNGSGNRDSYSSALVAPDGVTPVAGATVYVPSSSGTSAQAAEGCVEPSGSYQAMACTGADGTFTLSLPEGTVGPVILKAFKGVWETAGTFDPAQGIQELAFPSSVGNSFAVVTGDYDRLEDVLAKLGLGTLAADNFLEWGTETFDLYEGTPSNPSLPETYPGLINLFFSLSDYDVLFLNSGMEEDEILSDSSRVAALRQFVLNGGTLFATDWSYDFVETTFPEYIDFFGADFEFWSPDLDETEGDPGAAQNGPEYQSLTATILDFGLKAFLGQSGLDCEGGSCLNGNGTVTLRTSQGGWAMMKGAHDSDEGAQVLAWVESSVDGTVRPLTVSFPAGQGKIIYSSFPSEETPSDGFYPQDRILQYLMFEAGE